MRKMFLFGALIGTFALAQPDALYGTFGRGTMVNSAGHRATVRFQVGAFADNTLRGNLEFNTLAARASDRLVRIYLVRPVRLAVDGHNATFVGPGIMVTRTPNGEVRTQGQLEVHVLDASRPESANPVPDQMALRFMGPTAASSFRYEGAIREGDFRVFDNR